MTAVRRAQPARPAAVPRAQPPPGSPTAAPPPDEPLARALAAEHAAIHAYGLIGVWLGEPDVETARRAEARHRRHRDTLVVLLAEREVAAPVPAARYEPPFPLTGAADALRLAVLVEQRVAAVWRAMLPVTTGDDRALALDALVQAAVTATSWRRAAGAEPATVVYPGED